MDPKAVLELIADEGADHDMRLEACSNLSDWMRKGGAVPDQKENRIAWALYHFWIVCGSPEPNW